MSDLNRKIVSNKTTDLTIENELKILKTFDSSYFIGKSYFDEGGTQNYLAFQPMTRYTKTVNVKDINYVLSWKSKGLSDKKIESIKTANYLLNPHFDVYNLTKIRIKFNGGCLNRLPPTNLHGGIVNIYIVYEITSNFNASNYPTLENCLFESVKLTKNSDIDRYGYFGYGIGFDRKGFFSHLSGGTGKNVIIFGVHISSSAKIDNRKKDILILG